MKSKKSSAPSLSVRVSEIESRVSHLRDEMLEGDESLTDYVNLRTKNKTTDFSPFDWFLIGAYVIVFIIYIYLLSKSKKQ